MRGNNRQFDPHAVSSNRSSAPDQQGQHQNQDNERLKQN
jgi:hypothetical protein